MSSRPRLLLHGIQFSMKQFFTLSLLVFLFVCAVHAQQTAPQPAQPQPMFTLDFDDGFASAYQNALPVVTAAGYKSTWFIITGSLGQSGYMTRDQVVALDKAGQEIGAHTISHPNLATLSLDKQKIEIRGSQDYLTGLLGHTPSAFAYPYGARNGDTAPVLRSAGFTSARTTDWGVNLTGRTDPLQLQAYALDSTTSLDVVKNLIDTAPPGSWVIFVFHRVGEDDNSISVKTDTLKAIVDYLQSKKANVVTQSEGIKAMLGRIQ